MEIKEISEKLKRIEANFADIRKSMSLPHSRSGFILYYRIDSDGDISIGVSCVRVRDSDITVDDGQKMTDVICQEFGKKIDIDFYFGW